MADDNKKAASKKTVEVPKTDISKSGDKAVRRFIFWLVALIVVMVVVGAAVIYWLVGQYIKQSNKNKGQDQTITLLETKQSNLSLLKPNYEKITTKGAGGISDGDLILRAMPTDKAYDALIAMIERMAQESGVKVSSITQSAQDTGSTGPAGAYTFSVSLDGDYAKLLEFLKKTEQSARVMNFVSMSFSGNLGSGNITATVTLKTYFKTPVDINSSFEALK